MLVLRFVFFGLGEEVHPYLIRQPDLVWAHSDAEVLFCDNSDVCVVASPDHTDSDGYLLFVVGLTLRVEDLVPLDRHGTIPLFPDDRTNELLATSDDGIPVGAILAVDILVQDHIALRLDRGLFDRDALGVDAPIPEATPSEARIYLIYGVARFFYRWLIMFFIGFLLLSIFVPLGVFMLVSAFYGTILAPIWKRGLRPAATRQTTER